MQATTHPGHEPFQIHTVPLTRPLVWLSRGWEDLWDHPLPSLAYGIIVAYLGSVILVFNHHPYLLAASISCFFLIGPVMTTGLCELSRRRDQGEPRSFDDSLSALRHNREGLYGFARRLLLISVVWVLVSTMILSISLGSVAPGLADTVWGDVLRHLDAPHLLAYFGLGAVLAAIVFALSVVAIPMILDHNADANLAMLTSLQVFRRDLPVMLVWATLIVALVAIGFATFMAGMIIIFPLLGHATWQAYRDLVH